MKTPATHSLNLSLALLISGAALALTGCGGMTAFPDSVVTAQNQAPPPVRGNIFGGHAPVVGSHIYLLQPGTGAIGSIASSILGTGTAPTGYTLHTNPATGGDPHIPGGWEYVISDSIGGFDVTGEYTCAAGQPVYLYSWGGNPGTVNNTAIAQMAVLGNCPTSGALNFDGGSSDPINFVYMNEVSTIAAAYVFQPFTSSANNDAVHVGSSGTTQGLLGIENAAATAAQLYDIQGSQTCQSPPSTTCPTVGEGHIANYQTQNGGPNNGNGVVPQATIDTLGNILASCIDGATGAASASCITLFANATDNGATTGTKPTDTATAAINIARYPAGNHSVTAGVNTNFVSNIYNLGGGTVPFTPHLSTQPNDFTIAIAYPYTNTVAPFQFYSVSNPDLLRAESLSLDKAGNIWITGQGNLGGGVRPTLTRWSPLGQTQLTKTNSYIYGYVSVDGAGDAWTGNANATSSIIKFNSNGVQINTFGSGYGKAYTLITDNSGNAFFFASNTSTTGAAYNTYNNYNMWEYNAGGSLLSNSPNCGGNPGPFVYYCTSSGFIFQSTDNAAHGAIEAATGTPTSPGSAGHLWVTSESVPYQIARITPTGGKDFSITTNTAQPEFPSIDRNGVAWIANQAATGSIYKIKTQAASPFYNTTTISSGNGTTNGTALLAWTFGSAVDGNNNVWFTNRCGNYGGCGGGAGINSIIHINGSNNLAISPPQNYIPETQYYNSTGNGLTAMTPMLNDSLNLAIDPSGNVWITNYIGNSVVELVGAAAPVVTPLSAAAGANMLGTAP